ncbi:hypothetical protein SGCZBJ_14620 [Caulobacter zeae]|uniref:Uncharacterized protein n=1 Tax=Caulobacter zeae TaxID=2055137 RepID=A0A2N5DCN4_9CAUL|nr:hypothetical protein SGCZBJ_14620 [Caulobacter zeae]
MPTAPPEGEHLLGVALLDPPPLGEVAWRAGGGLLRPHCLYSRSTGEAVAPGASRGVVRRESFGVIQRSKSSMTS